MTLPDPVMGPLDLQQLLTTSTPDCCRSLLADLRRIHTVARQMFNWVLEKPVIDVVALERTLVSLQRQIGAGQELQPRLALCGAAEEVQAELASLLEYFETSASKTASRLGVR